MNAVHDKIRAFIVETFLFGDTSHDLPAEASLIENDIVDSTGILELVSFVEDEFGITVADSEILPANFDSIEKVAAFVESKVPAAAPLAAIA